MFVRTPFDYVLHSETILHDLHLETNQHIRNTHVRLANWVNWLGSIHWSNGQGNYYAKTDKHSLCLSTTIFSDLMGHRFRPNGADLACVLFHENPCLRIIASLSLKTIFGLVDWIRGYVHRSVRQFVHRWAKQAHRRNGRTDETPDGQTLCDNTSRYVSSEYLYFRPCLIVPLRPWKY